MPPREGCPAVPVEDKPPEWIRQHGLVVGDHYVTLDSDLMLRYLGHAQVRDSFGFRYVMVFRDLRAHLPLLTLNEADASECAGFVSLADHLVEELDVTDE